MCEQRRVVVTGVGAVTPYGVGAERFWEGCMSGQSAVTELRLRDESIPCRVAGQVDFDPSVHLGRVEARRLSRFCQFALVAAREALEDASLDPAKEPPGRAGIAIGNGSGDFLGAEKLVRRAFERGWAFLDSVALVQALPDMAAANLSMAFGFQGPILTSVAACSSSTIAIAQALTLLRAGRADVMIAGGAEAWITALGVAGFTSLRALSTRDCPPEEASCPFDRRRDGFVPSEGAAVLVLETEEHARSRGAPILAELAGAAISSDAYHLVAPRPDGAAAVACMIEAIEDAAIHPSDIDYVNAHGTSTKLNDVVEAQALGGVLGEVCAPLVSSTKSLIGHTLGAAGAIESVAVVNSIRDGVVHPGINLDEPDPKCQLNHVGSSPRQLPVKAVLKNSFAFGGQNASLVFTRYSEDGCGA
jgi:3-oxoacyl-[acyl-carrier-protein] synthase II